MARNTKLFIVLPLALVGLFACASENTSSNPDQETKELDGTWLSDCTTRYPDAVIIPYELEQLVVGGSVYERTIYMYQDSNCSVPADISFLTVRSTSLEYPGGSVETELGSASQIVVTSPMIDFDRSLLTGDDAALYDPALYFYDFYLFESDGRLRFGSTNTSPMNDFEQSLDSPHIFTAQ